MSAQTGLETPIFGTASASAIHYFPINDRGGFLALSESQSDYAVIQLDHGFPSLGTMELQPDFAGGAVSILGYPPTSGGALDFSSDVVQVSPVYSLLQGPTAGTNVGPGSSGGTVFVNGPTSPQVVGLTSSIGAGVTNFTQITRAALNQIQDWVRAEDSVALTGSAPPPPPAPAAIASVTVQGAHSDYTVASAEGALRLGDLVAGRDGTQALPGVAEIRFADGVGRFDASGHTEAVGWLYHAAFNRPANLWVGWRTGEPRLTRRALGSVG